MYLRFFVLIISCPIWVVTANQVFILNAAQLFVFYLNTHLKAELTLTSVLCKDNRAWQVKSHHQGKVDDSGLKADIFSTLVRYLKCDTICPSLSPPSWTSLGQAPGAAAFPLTLWPGSHREWGAGLDARGQWLWSSHVPQSCKVRNFKLKENGYICG